MITNLIEPRIEKLMFNHFIENRNILMDSYFFKLILRRDCLELCFWTVAFKTILTQQYYEYYQYYQFLSNQSFKHNSADLSSLSLTSKLFLSLGFVCSSLTFTTQKANDCSPWTPCLFM